MSKRLFSLRACLVLFALFCLSSCATYLPRGVIYDAYKVPAASDIKPEEKALLTFNFATTPRFSVRLADYERAVQQVFMTSNYFESVKSSSIRSPFHLQIEVRKVNTTPQNIATTTMLILRNLTLTAFPSYMTYDVIVTGTLYVHGKSVVSHEQKINFGELNWLPLMLIYPFIQDEYNLTFTKSVERFSSDFITKMKNEHYIPVSDPALQRYFSDYVLKGRLHSTATAFFISKKGHLLTSYHAVKNAKYIDVHFGKETERAEILSYDADKDLALLKIERETPKYLSFSTSPVKLADEVFTVGYPMPDIQGLNIKYSKGDISGLTGAMDTPFLYQISVPLQPGNSGGPLISKNGELVGVIHSKLEPRGRSVQNVNYAVKGTEAKDFVLKRIKLPPPIPDVSDQVELAQDSTVLLFVYN